MFKTWSISYVSCVGGEQLSAARHGFVQQRRTGQWGEALSPPGKESGRPAQPLPQTPTKLHTQEDFQRWVSAKSVNMCRVVWLSLWLCCHMMLIHITKLFLAKRSFLASPCLQEQTAVRLITYKLLYVAQQLQQLYLFLLCLRNVRHLWISCLLQIIILSLLF